MEESQYSTLRTNGTGLKPEREFEPFIHSADSVPSRLTETETTDAVDANLSGRGYHETPCFHWSHIMNRIVARPNQLDLDSPGRRDYWLALEHDSIWGDHLIPLTVWVGPEAKPNKGLVAFGSNHGNEYEGPVVLKNLLNEIKTRMSAGGSSLSRCSIPPRSARAPVKADSTTA